MAYVQNQSEEDQLKANQGPQSPTSGGVQTTAPSGVGSAGTTGGPSQTSQPGAGGSFASLTNYVNANQGNATPIAQQVTNQANQQFQTLQGQNQEALQGIQGQVAGGYTKNDPNLLAAEAADPTKFASDQNNIASFQKLLNDVYKGPQSAEGTAGFQKQQAATTNAIQQGQNLQSTEAGNKQLLGNIEHRPSASVTGLNEAILYNDPNATSQVQHAYDPFSKLNEQLSQGAGDINKAISQGQNEAQNASIASNKQLNDQFHGLNSQITNENQQAFNTANTGYQNLMGAFNKVAGPEQSLLDAVNKVTAAGSGLGGTQQAVQAQDALKAAIAANPGAQAFTPDMLKQLGISSDQLNQLLQAQQKLQTPEFVTSGNAGQGSAWTRAQNVPLTNWLQANAPTQANFTGATADEIARGNALNQIYGQNQFVAPEQGPAYQGPAFDFSGAMNTLNQGLGQVRGMTQQQADAIAANQLAQYNASKDNGLFGSGLGGFLGAAINPVAWIPNAINAVQNKPVSGMNMGQQYIKGI